MEKCPRCSKYTLAFSQFEGEEHCLKCGFTRKVNVEHWLREHDALPKLAKSLYLNY